MRRNKVLYIFPSIQARVQPQLTPGVSQEQSPGPVIDPVRRAINRLQPQNELAKEAPGFRSFLTSTSGHPPQCTSFRYCYSGARVPPFD